MAMCVLGGFAAAKLGLVYGGSRSRCTNQMQMRFFDFQIAMEKNNFDDLEDVRFGFINIISRKPKQNGIDLGLLEDRIYRFGKNRSITPMILTRKNRRTRRGVLGCLWTKDGGSRSVRIPVTQDNSGQIQPSVTAFARRCNPGKLISTRVLLFCLGYLSKFYVWFKCYFTLFFCLSLRLVKMIYTFGVNEQYNKCSLGVCLMGLSKFMFGVNDTYVSYKLTI